MPKEVKAGLYTAPLKPAYFFGYYKTTAKRIMNMGIVIGAILMLIIERMLKTKYKSINAKQHH